MIERLMEYACALLRPSCQSEAYYCNALLGESGYNICINSDMSISCNCQDYDGGGHLGSLVNNTFEEIFFGRIANNFRKKLARGQYPIPLCKNCMELRSATKIEASNLLKKARLPYRGIMVENTVLCNYNCLNCDRQSLMKIRAKLTMSIEDTKLVASILAKNKINSLCYFNLGEPFLDSFIYEKLSIIREYNPKIIIVISTNGSLINSDASVKAAMLVDRIVFSVDGSDDLSMRTYQINGSFSTCYENIKNLVEVRNKLGSQLPFIEWKYVVFSWNDSDEHIDRAVNLAKVAGVDAISFWKGYGEAKHMSVRFDTAPYFQTLGVASRKGREIVFSEQI